jgi:hypothetical protein
MFQRSTLATLVLTSFLPLPGGPAPGQGGAPAAPEPFELHPRPAEAVTLPAAGLSLWDLLAELERDTATHLVADKGIRDYLEGWPITLSRPMEVPAAARWSVAETYLAEAGGAFEELRRADPRLLAVRMPNQGGRQASPGVEPRFVPLDRVPSVAEYPASTISTTVHLPNADVRNLANSMRSLMTDTTQLSMVPGGNTDSMVVRGRAPRVAETCALLLAIEADAAAGAERRAAAGAAAERSPDAGGAAVEDV